MITALTSVLLALLGYLGAGEALGKWSNFIFVISVCQDIGLVAWLLRSAS